MLGINAWSPAVMQRQQNTTDLSSTLTRNCSTLKKIKGERYDRVLFVENMKITEMFNSNLPKFLSILIIESLQVCFKNWNVLNSKYNLKYSLFCSNLNVSSYTKKTRYCWNLFFKKLCLCYFTAYSNLMEEFSHRGVKAQLCLHPL